MEEQSEYIEQHQQNQVLRRIAVSTGWLEVLVPSSHRGDQYAPPPHLTRFDMLKNIECHLPSAIIDFSF